jgi:hypothetical protein
MTFSKDEGEPSDANSSSSIRNIAFNSQKEIVQHLIKCLTYGHPMTITESSKPSSNNDPTLSPRTSRRHAATVPSRHQSPSAEAVLGFLATSDALLKEIGESMVDFKPSVQEMVRGIAQFLVRAVKLWGPLKPLLLEGPTASLVTINDLFPPPLASVSPLYFFMGPLECAVATGSNAIETVCQKKAIKCQEEDLVKDLHQKNEIVKGMIKTNKAALEEVHRETEKRNHCLLPETYETLSYTSDIYKIKISQLEVIIIDDRTD